MSLNTFCLRLQFVFFRLKLYVVPVISVQSQNNPLSSRDQAKKIKIEEKKNQEQVKINIGVLVLKDGNLYIKRGATLPLTLIDELYNIR